MIGRMIDSVVGMFSPAAGLRRAHARRMLNHTQRGYDAARRDRLNAGWNPSNRSADLEMLADADLVRARVRDLVRNNPYAQGLLRAVVRNVVGRGIMPQAAVERANGSPNDKFNRSAEDLWKQWSRRCDVSGRLSFYQIQRLAFAEVLEAGEVLIHWTTSSDKSRPLPFALELIEADRLASDALNLGQRNPDNGNEIRRGVELNSEGLPVAYWLYPNHPSDVFVKGLTPERKPARNFLHLFKQTRVGQTRGVSSFAPVVKTLKDLHYYTENELVSSAVASCFSVAIKTVSAGADGGLQDTIDDDASDKDGNTFEYLQPGQVARLFPEEDVEVINPARANTAANEWITLLQHQIAAGFGISYERYTRDYSKTNYSSNRAGDLEDRREFRSDQDWLVETLCVETWRRFISAAVSDRADNFPNPEQYVRNYERFNSALWLPPGWEWVDPQKETKAAISAVESNQSTLQEECGKRGKDWRDVVDQRAIEQEYIRSKGLTSGEETEEVQTVEDNDDNSDDLPGSSDRSRSRSRRRDTVAAGGDRD